MKNPVRGVCAMSLLLLVAIHAWPGEIIPLDEKGWPQFRGPWRDGVSRETGLLQQWPENGPKLLWSVSDLGQGYSSPIITNDAIYVTGDVDKQLVIYAFSLEGRLLWKTPNGRAWTSSWPGARASCTYANGRLFHMNANGRVVCLDPKTGGEHWAVDVLDRFDGSNIKWALSECLLVDGNHVIVTPGGKKAFMAALDAKTGKTIWTTPPLQFQRTYAMGGKDLDEPVSDIDKAGYAPPILFEVGGRRLIARTSGQHLVCIDADTGEYVWTHKMYARFEVIGSIPVFWNDHLYFSAPDEFGGRMFSVKVDDEGVQIKEKWNTPLDNCHASVIVVDDFLLGSGYRRLKDWVCIDAASGTIKYKKDDLANGASIFADGRLYALGQDGVLELLKPDDDGFKTMGRLRLTEKKRRDVWAHPVICDGKLYLRDHDSMWCYDIKGPPRAQTPSYLKGYDELYKNDPHAAAIKWFKEAQLGLFIHYTLANLLDGGKPEYLKLTESMEDQVELSKLPSNHRAALGVSDKDIEPVRDVHKNLMKQFHAERFDADDICDLAIAANMRYVNFTTKHMGRMAMYKTKTTEFNSLNSPAGRDLVKEMADACAKKGLGLFLYVSTETARTDGDFLEVNHTILRELLTQYGPIAGIWFDGIGNYRKNPENYTRLSETFDLVRKLQPQCLVSFKEGAIGEEDFITPEHFLFPTPVEWDTPGRQARWEFRLERWERVQKDKWERWYKNKPAEINTVMQECYNRDQLGSPGGWINDENARHLTIDEVIFLYKTARTLDANLLINIGPRGDGSIHPDDVNVLTELGRRVKEL